jgi:predicted dienelactone hydrolase
LRTIEILLAALLLLLLLLPRFRIRRPKRIAWVIPWLLMLVLAVHLIFERYRWQMIPLYLATLLVAGVLLLRRFQARRTLDQIPLPFSSRWGFVLGAVILLLAIVFPIGLPVFRLPEPTGPYSVGTTELYFVDPSRPETFTQDPSDVRELIVTAWYPTDPSPGARPALYWEHADIVGGYLMRENGQPPALARYMTLVKANAFQDASISSTHAPFPVLIFSPGYMTNVLINTIQMEALASHGYVVFGIDHPYESFGSVYPDGRSALADPLLRELIIRGDTASIDFEGSLEIWTADTAFVLDQLERLNAPGSGSMWSGQLDLDNVGVFGVSFGGATAGAFCYQDPRCAAGVNIDGYQHGANMRGAVLQQPFMFIYSPGNAGTNNGVYRNVDNQAYSLTIAGSQHMGFSDLAFASPILRYSNILGSISPVRLAEITNAYLLAFFDKHLKGEAAPLLEAGGSIYPEVNFRTRTPSTDT